MKNKNLIYLSIFAILISLCCYVYLNTNLKDSTTDPVTTHYESDTMNEDNESIGFTDMAIFESIADTIKYLATLRP